MFGYDIMNDMETRGFTLVELLMVIAITLILVVITVPIYGNLQVKSQLNETTRQIIQTLRIAKENSMARVNNTNHGVYFATSSYTLYQGVSFFSRDSDYDREESLSDVLTLTWDWSGSARNINFSMGFGAPNATGIINLLHSMQGTSTVSVGEYGLVEKQ